MAAEALPARGGRWSRGISPLMMIGLVMAVLMIIFPSALRIPQTDPTPVLEYAPVPPSDEDPPNPPPGNLSALALGTSSSLVEGVEPPPPPPPPGDEETIQTKRCVGKPPRQTEDPMAPPCVAHFEGNNFGATWQGVDKDEIAVVIYYDSGSYNFEMPPDAGIIYDLDAPAKPACPKTYPAANPQADTCDFLPMRIARAFNVFFNTRFQTYNRRAHYYLYLSDENTAAGRRADAALLYDRLHPFAVIDQATFSGHNQSFDAALAARQVLVFTQETALPNSFFRESPGFSWGFWPDVEHWADQFVSYVCTKVAPYRVSHSGNPQGTGQFQGRERKYGFYYTTDPGEQGLHEFREQAIAGLRKCGVEGETATYQRNGFVTDGGDRTTDQALAVSKFRNAEVTTVLWLGGVEGRFSVVAADAQYFPEIIIAGDLDQDNNVTARNQDQRTWQNAWATHFQIRHGQNAETPGYAAYREAYPQAPAEEARYANDSYRDHFMLFQAIQVAGPRLNPQNIDKGFHAIPEKSSTDPFIASCFFDPGDYSCVKDSTEIWWDPSGQSPGDGQAGCWRLVREGKRYLAGKWPSGDDAFDSGSDPCTGYDAARRLRPA